ncbi:MAG: questin oxidase family protein [Coxiellaceae bacterium]|nr:questin oxidase family protein [Coxiellaceae bacterium]
MLCDQQLSGNRNLLPNYGDHHFANHASMVLVALEKMGADKPRMQKYFDDYAQRLKLQPALKYDIEINEGNWQHSLGNRKSYSAYRDFFSEQCKRDGQAVVLNRYLPLLLQGVGCDAFHPAIRLAYALDSEQAEEVAAALAYWATAYWPIKVATTENRQAVSAGDYLQALSQHTDLKLEFDQPAIDARMQVVLAQAAFNDVVGSRQLAADQTLDQIAAALIRLYQQTKDFTLLHGVTSCHAMRLLLPYVEDKAAALHAYWHAICAAYVTVGSPQLNTVSADQPVLPWEQIKQKVLNSDNDHTIKLTYTCWQQFDHTKDPVYHQVATQLVSG